VWRRIRETIERSRKEIDFLEILRKREAKERAPFAFFLVLILRKEHQNRKKRSNAPKIRYKRRLKGNSLRVYVQFFYINWTIIDVSFKKCISLQKIIDERRVGDSVINICI
jgi:hypothetical protein